ncbi:Catalase [Salmonella enterica subsp. enterica serovar Adelaide str. A4-669]|uniref:Catalase n=1 Tax=Salmonella enterica subsp. enterica serovar Adelaide str. A4-669 TaxID=913063 RepID=A0A6C8GMX6_SALET|nr:Catalase [Salmonella enterica subsp. enterica serovar Adelaide str. A4-669]
MSHNEKSPHQSPVHDTRESQPGLDSLAPSDGSHRPTPEPTPPGAQGAVLAAAARRRARNQRPPAA